MQQTKELTARALDCALCLYAFAREHPEAERAYMGLSRVNLPQVINRAAQDFQTTHNPAPVIDVIETVYRQIRYLAAPAGNWN